MDHDTRLLRIYQVCLVLGGSFAVFAVLDVVLGFTGIYPWADTETAATRLAVGIVIAAVAFLLAVLVWREREDRDLGAATFGDVVITLGFMLVGGFLLLGALR